MNGYLDTLKEKSVLVVGLGISGRASIEALAGKVKRLALQDSKEERDISDEDMKFLKDKGVECHFAHVPEDVIDFDMLVLSPGVPPAVAFVQEAKNAGAEIIQGYMDKLSDDVSPDRRSEILGQCRKEVIDVLKSTVRPEFLNRIDEIIMFEPLTKKDIREILHLQMADLREKLAANGVSVSFSKAFEDYMTEKGYDPAYGARPIKRLMQRELVNLIAKAILDGSVHKESEILVDVSEGAIRISGK